jgi:Flp pilus assembly protein TadB
VNPLSLYARLALYAAIGLAVLAAAWKVYHTIDKRGYNRAIAEQAVKDASAKEIERLETKRRQNAADKLQEQQNAKTQADGLRIAELTRSLRNRPERPSQASGNSSTAANCTGAGLYRVDGEFLTWYAAEAQRISNALKRCEAQYNKVRSTP